jgi:hypothetical protein
MSQDGQMSYVVIATWDWKHPVASQLRIGESARCLIEQFLNSIAGTNTYFCFMEEGKVTRVDGRTKYKRLDGLNHTSLFYKAKDLDQ